MDRFVAMIWDEADSSKLAQIRIWSEALQRKSPRWTVVLDVPGLRVLSLIHRGHAPIVTIWQGQNGVIVGPLFARGHEKNGRVRVFDRREAERIVATGGDSLIRDYWGNYVALWRDEASRRTTVLRDPCGAVPCFMTQIHGARLLFSHADDVATIPGVDFTIDWTYLQAFVFYKYFVTKYTGLNEVTELLPGERLQSGPKGADLSWAWNGPHIAAKGGYRSFNQAKVELRATAEACFAAWGSEYRKIIVSLSGGLDSSILVNLLRRVSSVDIVGLHYLGVGYEQYESRLARLAAAHANIQLAEAVQDPMKDEVWRIIDAPRLARPKEPSLGVLIDDISTNLAEDCGADAFMIGHGGDNLFLQRTSAKHTLADYVRDNGLGPDFWRVAYDTSVLRQCSIWKALSDAFNNVVLDRTWLPFEFLQEEGWAKHRPFAVNAIRAIPNDYKYHPWFADASRLAHGKADHLRSAVALYNYHLHHGRGLVRDVIYPYFSQPIVELVLRTPTYVLCEGGGDRELERHAFADLIPESIARRTEKAGANHYLLQVMQRNIDFYRDLILNGALVAQRWVDRDRIESLLSDDNIVSGKGKKFVQLLVAAEAWLRSWRYSGAPRSRIRD